jgi:hypothetical protein
MITLTANRVSAVERIDHCCVLAAVGQGMVQRKGVAATMMGALAKANVNIKAIAQVRAPQPHLFSVLCMWQLGECTHVRDGCCWVGWCFGTAPLTDLSVPEEFEAIAAC